jgi:hypothetical protein
MKMSRERSVRIWRNVVQKYERKHIRFRFGTQRDQYQGPTKLENMRQHRAARIRRRQPLFAGERTAAAAAAAPAGYTLFTCNDKYYDVKD